MKLHTLIISLLSLSALTVSAATPGAAAREMAPYVYPDNRPSSAPQMTFMADGESYAALDTDGRRVVKYSIKTGEEAEVLFDATHTRETSLGAIEGFALSPDESKLLVWTDSRPIYRRSFTAAYYTYDIRTRLLRPLSGQFQSQQSPVFSPDGRVVAFVAENNIYLRKLDYQTEVAVTTDGAAGQVINGTSDWTYEEEFQTTCSMTWAPDALTLCYLKYNETAVPTYDMTRYYSACSHDEAAMLYPQTWSYKYPVAGEANSRVSLHSYDIETRKTKDITLPDQRIEYIPRIAYGPDSETLVTATLNRDQNHYEIYRVNPKSGVAKSIYTEYSKTWIAPVSYESLAVESDGLVINSWRDGFNALYFITYSGSERRRVQHPQADITEYHGTDAQGNVYYTAATPTPLDRTLTRLSAKGVCATVGAEKGITATRMAPGCKYMVTSYQSTQTAPRYSINTSAGKEVRVLQDNAAYAARVAPRHAERRFFTMTSDGNTLNGYMVLPAAFTETKKYPVVMYQYSGPGSQEVLNRWQYDWMDAFAAAGYVTVCVDGRGTGGRGREFCDVVYRNLGHYETIDQLAAARYVASQPWADTSRIAIYGWSYGGYEALMCATAGSDIPYAAAVAIAPVTDWRFYDTVYAERYMLTPQQNESGYNASSPLRRTLHIGCPTLLMYGTADDNVHPANTLEFVSRLLLQGDLCDMLVFPNMNHSINGCNARSVVFAKMLQWLNTNMR